MLYQNYEAAALATRILSLGSVVLLILAILYFIPSLIAFFRAHPHTLAIFVVNLVFGLTLVGWIGCLVWALITPKVVDIAVPVRIKGYRSEPWIDSDGQASGGRREPLLIVAPEKTCPSCAETIKAAAVKCRFCGYEFS